MTGAADYDDQGEILLGTTFPCAFIQGTSSCVSNQVLEKACSSGQISILHGEHCIMHRLATLTNSV